MDEIVIIRQEIRKAKSGIDSLRNSLQIIDTFLSKQCTHEFEKVIPSGPRENGEFYYSCTKCGYQK